MTMKGIKSNAERTIEALTWAAVVIWLGFCLIAHLLGYPWLVVMVLGIILLSSAIYQRSRGWHTSLSIWIAGIWMAVFSVVAVSDEIVDALDGEGSGGLGIDLWVYLGIALVSMGVAVVMRSAQMAGLVGGDERQPARSRTRQARERYTSEPRPSDQRRSAAPRRVEEDHSSGYVEPARASRSARSSRPRRSSSRQESRRMPAASSPRRNAQPVAEPNDLETRVEDIIRRSRERRGADTDDLPY